MEQQPAAKEREEARSASDSLAPSGSAVVPLGVRFRKWKGEQDERKPMNNKQMRHDSIDDFDGGCCIVQHPWLFPSAAKKREEAWGSDVLYVGLRLRNDESEQRARDVSLPAAGCEKRQRMPQDSIDHFDGGRAFVQDPRRCPCCNGCYAVASCFITCHADGNIPVTRSHQITRATAIIQEVQTGQAAPFKNQLDYDASSTSVTSMCFHCYGEKFKGSKLHYVKNTCGGHSKLSAEWFNLRKRFYGRGAGVENKLVKHLFKQALAENPESELRLSDAYIVLCQQPLLATGADFHIVLGGGIMIIYSDPNCGTAPIQSKHWLRCSKKAGQHLAGGTCQRGKWHCPKTKCLQRWNWASGGSKRVLLIPDSDDMTKLRKVVIGRVSPAQEHTITLLKGAQLVLHAFHKGSNRKVALGKQAVINGIKILNQRAGKRILSSLEHITLKSANRQEIKRKGLIAYCEDSALSLSEPGQWYKALEVPSHTPELNDEDRQNLLDALCCFYDFSGSKPSSSGELRDAWDRAQSMQDACRRIYWPSWD